MAQTYSDKAVNIKCVTYKGPDVKPVYNQDKMNTVVLKMVEQLLHIKKYINR